MRMCVFALGLLACSSPAAPVKPPAAAPRAAAQVAAAAVDRGLEPAAPALRLPRNFTPTSYTATLAIDPAQAGFDGTIAIAGELAQRSSVIWLHGRGLAIKRASATRGAAEIALTAAPHGDELLALRAATPLDPGSWTLAIEYTGGYDLLNTTGAFKQTVRGAAYVYTQFEALYARRVFPCFDEPDSKVPWQLTLDVPADLVAVSNTSITREQPLGGGRKRVAFARTRPLPSYLVAFGVGPFDVVDAGHTRSGTPVRIIAMKERAPETAWAARTTAKLVDLLEDFFGSPYPYDKLDMLAIPVTVGFGAMENAGLVTFTETLMLLDPRHGSREREYAWITVAAHELALAQRGLRELGRAQDLGAVRAGVERPARRGRHAQLGARRRQPGQRAPDPPADRDVRRHPQRVRRHHLRQGRERAQHVRGLRRSRRVHARRARLHRRPRVRQRDLDRVRRRDQQGRGAGHRSGVRDLPRAARRARDQQRYVPPGAPVPPATRPWIVPVCVAFDRGGKRGQACTMLDAPTGAIELDAASCPRWVMANLDGRGYYRTAYTAAQITALRDLAWSQLAPTERRVLFVDTANAATLGRLPLALALSFAPR
ncbi:MAG: M1 family metallopeptidase, partial [Deltaproteobacteria bacterium]